MCRDYIEDCRAAHRMQLHTVVDSSGPQQQTSHCRQVTSATADVQERHTFLQSVAHRVYTAHLLACGFARTIITQWAIQRTLTRELPQLLYIYMVQKCGCFPFAMRGPRTLRGDLPLETNGENSSTNKLDSYNIVSDKPSAKVM